MGEVNYDRTDSGYSTARVSASQQDRLAREQRQADALAYLHRKGLDVPDANGVNVAEILGLVRPSTPAPRRKRKIPAPREDH